MQSVLGLHHVTAIAGDPQRNFDFYTGVLGLRFVKRTINYDDPSTYHFYFGDEAGTPGSILTFFPWPGARQGRQGPGQVGVVSFAIVPGALGFWVERLIHLGVAHEGPTRRATAGGGEQVISFRDPDGLLLELVADARAAERPSWGGAPGISAEMAIHGFHAVSLWVEEGEATERLLVDTLGYRLVHEEGARKRFEVGDGGPGRMVDLRVTGGFVRALGGAGTVHHVAIAVADEAEQLVVRDAVVRAGHHATSVMDRTYFQSVYFRETGGVLFELATMEPGFAVDEPLEALGQRLTLPARLEEQRQAIEAGLPPVRFAEEGGTPDGDELGFVHRYVAPTAEPDGAGGVTLLLLHGTGGNEEDLLGLGRALLPGAGLLSPRGQVLERGAPRFFRRVAEGAFDQEDLTRRTEELAAFVEGAAGVYGFDRGRVVAVGFSNGANIAASLLLRRAGLLAGAVLLSPMVPFEPEAAVDLAGTAVFIGAGRTDPIAPAAQAERLAELLGESGAEVELHWEPGGHQLTDGEVEAARAWMARFGRVGAQRR